MNIFSLRIISSIIFYNTWFSGGHGWLIGSRAERPDDTCCNLDAWRHILRRRAKEHAQDMMLTERRRTCRRLMLRRRQNILYVESKWTSRCPKTTKYRIDIEWTSQSPLQQPKIQFQMKPKGTSRRYRTGCTQIRIDRRDADKRWSTHELSKITRQQTGK